MSKTMMLAAVMLVAFAVIYSTGTTLYPQRGERLNLGVAGIGVFGALRAVAGVGFIVAATELLADLNRWSPALIAVKVSPPFPAALDSSPGFAGTTLNVAMLIAVFRLRHSSV